MVNSCVDGDRKKGRTGKHQVMGLDHSKPDEGVVDLDTCKKTRT